MFYNLQIQNKMQIMRLCRKDINLTIQNEVKLMLKKKQWYFICDWNIMFLIYDVFLISCYFNKREQKK